MAQFTSEIKESDLDMLMSLVDVEPVAPAEIDLGTSDAEVKSKIIEKEVKEEEIDLESLVDTEDEPKKQEAKKKENTGDFFKATASFLLNKAGLDEEAINEVETWDEETFGEFLDEIYTHEVGQRYSQLKTSDPLAEKVLDIIEQGGAADEIISLYRDQKEIKNINTSTSKGKLEKIRRYYKDIEMKTDAWVERTIDRLERDDEDLVFEFDEVNDKYDSHFEKEAQKKVDEEKVRNNIKRDKEIQQRQKMQEYLGTLKIKKEDINEIEEFAFNDKAFKVRGTNQTMSAFDVQIAMARQKPEKLFELVEFLKDKDKYIKRVITEARNETTDNKFNSYLTKAPNKTGSDVKLEEKSERVKFRLK